MLFNQTDLDLKLKKHILSKEKIEQAQNIAKRWLESVDTSKERENQQSFLQDFFGTILDYQAVAGEKDNTLWWESGSVVDGKKPDGILGFHLLSYKTDEQTLAQAGDVRVVIELKDDTVKLDEKQKRKDFTGTPVEQAFSYAHKVGGACEFVILSNFKEIRLYKAGDSSRYHSFLLDALAKNPEKIKEFHCLLSKNRLFTQTPKQSPTHSLDQAETGESIEKRFYREYKNLREVIWQNLQSNNTDKPQYSETFYLYKAQKLIDRIIFIRFCRENGALDNDAVQEALNNKYVKGKYERMKLLFRAMDEGNPEIGIAKFNGGLFAADNDLDALRVEDFVIDEIKRLYDHHFGSDLDVNILGHIFEQSISDLEHLSGSQEKKRKKDGVFYTPAYITEYIVREAVGGWLNERKQAILKEHKEGSDGFWRAYVAQLKAIKVLDPACGSGAFLVKVFDYLQSEWERVPAKFKEDYRYDDILKNNIFGVDINVASVGITKLSLWLKTAHNKEPLTSLDNNIKVGNSLIDDKAVAGFYHEYEGRVVHESLTVHKGLWEQSDLDAIEESHKKSLAFVWEKEFPQVFEQNGFDVIVGNPPYVNAKNSNFTQKQKDFYYANYETAEYQLDTFILFIEKAHKLLQIQGFFSMIIPNIILANLFISKIRKFLLTNTVIKTIGLCHKVFEEAHVDTLILTTQKQELTNHQVQINQVRENGTESLRHVSQDGFKNNQGLTFSIYLDDGKLDIFKKIKLDFLQLDALADISTGIKEYQVGKGKPPQTNVEKETLKFHANYAKDSTYLPEIRGYNLNRFSLYWDNEYISYGSWLAEPRDPKFFEGDRILMRQIPSNKNLICSFTNENYVVDQSLYIAKINNTNFNNLFVLALLNSRLLHWYFQNLYNEFDDLFPKIKVSQFRELPIKNATTDQQQPLITLSQTMLDLNQQLHKTSRELIEFFKAKFDLSKITRALEAWYTLSFADFLKEVYKQRKTGLSSEAEFDFQKLFEREKAKCLDLQTRISATDREIDQLVYQLYGLTAEEIALVEEQVSAK